jgi:hypothetical protein
MCIGAKTAMNTSVYRICVQGRVDQSWSDWFEGMAIAPGRTSGNPPVTTLIGPVADQVALRGILSRIWDLNLTVISVTRIKGGSQEGGK